MFRTIGATAAVTAVLALAACSESTDEPAGLAGDTTTAPGATDSAQPSETPETSEPESPGTGGSATNPEPTSTFTQPYLPRENVVELRDTIPVEPPAGATPEELAVLDAFEHVQAAWEQILWGVPFEESGFADYATGAHLETVRDYAEESVELQRVSVGPPQEQHVLSVDVDGATATVVVCVNTSGWSDVLPGGPKPDGPLDHGTLAFERADEEWKSTQVSWSDDVSACEGVFD